MSKSTSSALQVYRIHETSPASSFDAPGHRLDTWRAGKNLASPAFAGAKWWKKLEGRKGRTLIVCREPRFHDPESEATLVSVLLLDRAGFGTNASPSEESVTEDPTTELP